MSIDVTTEKRFEEDIEAFFISPTGGYTKGTDTYDPALGLYVNTLIEFIQRTQPKEWARFENQNKVDPVRKFCRLQAPGYYLPCLLFQTGIQFEPDCSCPICEECSQLQQAVVLLR